MTRQTQQRPVRNDNGGREVNTMTRDTESSGGARPMQAALLRAIRLDLDRIVRPDLRSPEAIMTAQLASEMLAFLIVGARDLSVTDPAAALAPLLERSRALLQAGGLDAAEGLPPDAPASELHDDAAFGRTAAELSANLSALLAARAAGHGDATVAGLARAAIDAEYARLRDEHALVTREIADTADPLAGVETVIDRERMQHYADTCLAALEPGRVEHVERIPGGYSKDTWRVGFDRGIGGHRNLILRRDLPFGPGENTVGEELQLLRVLHAAGLDVPPPLWHEPDSTHLGRPFLLFPQLPGKAVFGEWHAGDTERRNVILEIARLMARLHAIDPFAAGVGGEGAGKSPQEIVRENVRFWRAKWLRRRVHPSTILDVAFDWLERNAPAKVERVSIVHSDISFRNTLIEGGHLQALLDWEFWHLGDAMEDLSYFRLVAEPYIPWSDFMAAYREAGGIDYDPERAAFYEVWRSVRNGTTTTTAWNGFLSGAYPASKAAYQGVSLYRLFLRDVADKLGSVEL